MPIDPALLEEEEEDDMADAEGELVGDDEEWIQAGVSDIHADPVQPALEYYANVQPSTQSRQQPVVDEYGDPLHAWELDPNIPIQYDQYDTSAPPAYPTSDRISGKRARTRGRDSTHRSAFDTLSSVSGSSPAPPAAKRRGRPPKNRDPDPNGHSVSRTGSTSTSLIPIVLAGPSRTPSHAKSVPPKLKKRKSNSVPRGKPIRDAACSFCFGSDHANTSGEAEWMVSCSRCGRSGHPSCLGFKGKKIRQKIFEYDWICIDCKMCEICHAKGDDVSLKSRLA